MNGHRPAAFGRHRFTPLIPIATVVLFFVLNAILTIERWFGSTHILLAIFPALETVLIAALLVLPVPLVIPVLLSAVIAGFSLPETLFRFYYDRPFSIATDIGMVRNAMELLRADGSAVPPWVVLPVVAAVIAGIALIMTIILLPLRRSFRDGGPRPVTALLLAMTVLVGVSACGGVDVISSRPVWTALQPPPTAAVRQIARSEREPSPAQQQQYTFPGLQDRDILTFLVEAYGHTSFSRPELFQETQPYLDELAAALRNQGYHLVSGFLEAPVSGGFSWLAESTLLTGQLVNRQAVYQQLQEIPDLWTLPRMLHQGGYYTLAVKPGSTVGSWPEGWEVFGFERSLVAHDGDFNYRGPLFSFVPVTDQHAIWTAHQHLLEVRAPGSVAADRPLHVHYQLVSSHAPFNLVPPYFPDWTILGDGTIYRQRAEEILRFNNTWTTWDEIDQGYIAATGYTLRTIAGYIDKYLHRELLPDEPDNHPLVIIMGDHQPQRPVRLPEDPWSVPVHIATTDRWLRDRLLADRFTEGMVPREPAPHRHMMDFYPFLAEVFSAPR